jgi:hypothetical protein
MPIVKLRPAPIFEVAGLVVRGRGWLDVEGCHPLGRCLASQHDRAGPPEARPTLPSSVVGPTLSSKGRPLLLR